MNGIWTTFSQLSGLSVLVVCGVPPAVENATRNIDANVSLTSLQDLEYHCDHGHTTDGDPKRNTSIAS